MALAAATEQTRAPLESDGAYRDMSYMSPSFGGESLASGKAAMGQSTRCSLQVSSVIRLVIFGEALPVYAVVGAGGLWLHGTKVSANVLQVAWHWLDRGVVGCCRWWMTGYSIQVP